MSDSARSSQRPALPAAERGETDSTTGRKPIETPSVTIYEDNMDVLKRAYQALGEPEALRFFTKNSRVAFVPANPEHPNSYPVMDLDSTYRVASAWMKKELEIDDLPSGRHELEEDDGLWVLNLSEHVDDSGGDSGAA